MYKSTIGCKADRKFERGTYVHLDCSLMKTPKKFKYLDNTLMVNEEIKIGGSQCFQKKTEKKNVSNKK